MGGTARSRRWCTGMPLARRFVRQPRAAMVSVRLTYEIMGWKSLKSLHGTPGGRQQPKHSVANLMSSSFHARVR